MVKEKADDKSLVADILTAALLHNKSVNYLIPQDGLKMFRIHELTQYSFEMCMLFWKVFLSEDRKGCALLVYSDQKRFSFRSLCKHSSMRAHGKSFQGASAALFEVGKW